MNEDLIKDLRHKRDLIKERIKLRVNKHKYVKSLIKDYYKLTDELYELGFTIPVRANYMTLDYWGMSIDDLFPITSAKLKDELINSTRNKIQQTPNNQQKNIESINTKINIEPEQSYYIINLAWTETQSDEQVKILNILDKYFLKFNAKNIETEFNDQYKKEYISKYEILCSKSDSIIIRKSAQFIIDTLSTEETNKCNTVVYINKKQIN